MEKNQNIKYEYINRSVKKGSPIIEYLNYTQAQEKAKTSLEGLDKRLLEDKFFIKSIIKDTKDTMLWVRVGKDVRQDVDVCALALLRNFINWTQVEPNLKNDKRVICAAAYNFKNQELFEPYGVSRSPDLLAYILDRPKMPLHHNIVKHWVKNDQVMEIIVDKKPYFYKEASSKIRRNIKIAKKALQSYPHYLGLESDLWSDKKVAKEVINANNINYAVPEIQTDHNFILPIIKKNPHIIYSLCDEAKNDPTIVLYGIAAEYLNDKSELNLQSAKNEFNFTKFAIGPALRKQLEDYSIESSEQFEHLLKLAMYQDLTVSLNIQSAPISTKIKVKI